MSLLCQLEMAPSSALWPGEQHGDGFDEQAGV